MFGNIKPYSPVTQDYIWVAEYYGGGISEFDLETKESNSFYDIDKSKLQRFGLIGKGKKMWFECYRGVFNINGNVYELIYRTDKDYKLTGQDMFYRDIITYKQAIADIDLTKRVGSSESKIVGYYFGYKTELKIDDITFNFKPIISIPINKPMYIDIHLVANKDLKGELLFVKNGDIIDTIYAPLKKDVAGGIKWRVI